MRFTTFCLDKYYNLLYVINKQQFVLLEHNKWTLGMAILNIGKEGNNDGKQGVKGCSKRDACKDSRRSKKGDCCQKPLDLRIELDDGFGVCRRMGCSQQDEYSSWPS